MRLFAGSSVFGALHCLSLRDAATRRLPGLSLTCSPLRVSARVHSCCHAASSQGAHGHEGLEGATHVAVQEKPEAQGLGSFSPEHVDGDDVVATAPLNHLATCWTANRMGFVPLLTLVRASRVYHLYPTLGRTISSNILTALSEWIKVFGNGQSLV